MRILFHYCESIKFTVDDAMASNQDEIVVSSIKMSLFSVLPRRSRKAFTSIPFRTRNQNLSSTRKIDEGAQGRWWGSGHLRRGGGRLEATKFCLYLSIPIFASYIYSYPENINLIVSKFRYVVYPAEGPRPPVNDELVDILKAKREERQNQISTPTENLDEQLDDSPKKKGWFGF
mmetsp:Transcript_19016/g.24811  ORF Transcript_19016/g.24811 Transcript_19016/m.24811 type:complete len:175 (+) Transcript_19016:1340-1864(+)